jgi:hypothetical protein
LKELRLPDANTSDFVRSVAAPTSARLQALFHQFLLIKLGLLIRF